MWVGSKQALLWKLHQLSCNNVTSPLLRWHSNCCCQDKDTPHFDTTASPWYGSKYNVTDIKIKVTPVLRLVSSLSRNWKTSASKCWVKQRSSSAGAISKCWVTQRSSSAGAISKFHNRVKDNTKSRTLGGSGRFCHRLNKILCRLRIC